MAYESDSSLKLYLREISKTPLLTLKEEVGHEFGVSRERVRQLQNAALAKMRKALLKKDKPALRTYTSAPAET